MSFDFKNCSEEGLWKFVGEHLSANGFDCVLVGGAVVAIYSDGVYQSGDLDFVVQNLSKDEISKVMEKIGFQKKDRYYEHPECHSFLIEFPSGPLTIGDDYNIRPRSVESKGKIIKNLSPTDCIKDPLATFIYYESQEGMDQAVLVAQSQTFNKSEVRKWCKNEGYDHVFDDFIKLVNK